MSMPTTTTEPILEALAEGTWQRAYVAWRAAHGDQLWAVSCAVPDVATLQLIHGLIEDAVRAGWTARAGGHGGHLMSDTMEARLRALLEAIDSPIVNEDGDGDLYDWSNRVLAARRAVGRDDL